MLWETPHWQHSHTDVVLWGATMWLYKLNNYGLFTHHRGPGRCCSGGQLVTGVCVVGRRERKILIVNGRKEEVEEEEEHLPDK